MCCGPVGTTKTANICLSVRLAESETTPPVKSAMPSQTAGGPHEPHFVCPFLKARHPDRGDAACRDRDRLERDMKAVLIKPALNETLVYFTGTINLMSVQGSDGNMTRAVGNFGYFIADAHVFDTAEEAGYWAGVMNDDKVGDVDWNVRLLSAVEADAIDQTIKQMGQPLPRTDGAKA